MNEWERRSRFVAINNKVFQRTKYINFILEAGLGDKLIESEYSSPKNFVRERHMDKWLAYQVVKRME